RAGRPSDLAREIATVPFTVAGGAGALVVTTVTRMSRRTRESIETIAAQVALALEGASTAEDLHERRTAERFPSLVQHSTDVIALVSPDLTIRYHTPSVERVLGYGDGELVGVSIMELVRPGDAQRIENFFAEVCALPGTPMPRDLALRRKDGSF